MESARMRALLAPFLPAEALAEAQLSALSAYLELLLRWNARMNLTAVRDPEAIVTRHFGESLFAARHLFPPDSGLATPGSRLVDIGSGAGFPGLPIKLYAPGLDLTLIESNYRKAIFLREVIRALALPQAEVFPGRAQDYVPPSASSLSCTLRAVERFAQTLPVAARLLEPAGTAGPGRPLERRLALLIGAAQVFRAQELAPGLAWTAPLPVPLSSARVLLIGSLHPL
jgi:16S rRNA (guanine527-N7)-methyltransferase